VGGLRVERNAGHGGADLRREEVQKTADLLSFARAVLGGAAGGGKAHGAAGP
jgi:hypothetical protein